MTRRTFPAAMLAPLLAQGVSAAQRAGFAEADITPDIGMEMPGNYFKQFHSSFHDACKVRAAVLGEGAKKVAIVGIDALKAPRSLVVAARSEIERRTGIPQTAILIAASHSHSGGPVGSVMPGEYDAAPPEIQELAYKRSTAADPRYLAKVTAGIVEAVVAANARLSESAFGFGTGIEDKVLFNRRFLMKNGLTFTHPRPGNPDVVKAAGPVDPTVTVLAAFGPGKKLAGCIVNYACHATTSPAGISANWIYYMENVIRGTFGKDVVVVFTAGFSGDVTQVDNLNPHRDGAGDEFAQVVGGSVGAEAVKVILRMHPGAAAPVEFRTTDYSEQRRAPSAERLAAARAIAFKDMKEVGVAKWVFAKEVVMLDWHLSQSKTVPIELQAIQVGPMVFLATPGEMFTQLGLDLKRQSRFPFTVPVSVANGIVGYVPTLDAFGKHGGGYEQRLTTYTNLAIDAGPRMVAKASDLIRSLTPGKMPVRPPHAPFRAPWDYGDKGPEIR